MTRGKLIFIIALIMVVLATISFFILKKYSTIFADQFTTELTYSNSGGTSYITHQWSNTAVKYGISSAMSNGVDIYNTNGKIIGSCGGSNSCSILQISAGSISQKTMPALSLVATKSYGSVALTGIVIDKPSADRYFGVVSNLCPTIKTHSYDQIQGYICDLKNYRQIVNGINQANYTTGLKTLDASTWWTSYYNYVLNIKNATVYSDPNNIQAISSDTCNAELPKPGATYTNTPPEVTAAFNALITKLNLKNFNPTTALGGPTELKSYLNLLDNDYIPRDQSQPWIDFPAVQTHLTNTQNGLSTVMGGMWTQSDVNSGTMQSAKDCVYGSILSGALVARGLGVVAGLKGAAITESVCTGIAYKMNEGISDATKTIFYKALAQTVYETYYANAYLAYLGCLRDNTNDTNTKDKINQQINWVGSQYKSLLGMEADATNAASADTGFWGTIMSGFTEIMRNLMATILNFLWKNIFDGSPL